MSKTYALKRLLEHGPMRFAEIVECTGWEYRQVEVALLALLQSRRIKCRKDFHRWSRYEAVKP